MILDATDVTVLYRRGFSREPIRALDGFSIQIKPGDVFGLLGPNGAGKSTAMYGFLGLIRPNRGTIQLFGEPPQPGAAVFDRIAYVPEEPHYHLYLTVEEAVTFYGSLYRQPVSSATVASAIDRVGLREFADLRMDKCSKGMKQKVGLATCLLTEPQLVFLDEPTRGLDPIMVKEFRDIVLEMNARGTTFLINSHILSEVEMVCNRVAVMDHGRVLVQDSLRNLTQGDGEHYAVAFSATDTLPAFLTVTQRSAQEIRGIVPTAQLGAFMEFARAKPVTVFECTLKRLSLEEVFMGLVRRP